MMNEQLGTIPASTLLEILGSTDIRRNCPDSTGGTTIFRDVCPAAGIAPVDGALYWFVDEAAASRLSAKRQ